MPVFDWFSKKHAGPPPAKQPAAAKRAEKAAETSAETKDEKKDKKAEKTEVVRHSAKSGAFAHLLRLPHVSEKAAVLAERGVYVFDVARSANKTEIGKAVEAAYGVHVERVRTASGIGKIIRRGKVAGRRNAWKKALVELRKGEKISLVEGV